MIIDFFNKQSKTKKGLLTIALLSMLYSCSTPSRNQHIGIWDMECNTSGSIGTAKLKLILMKNNEFEAVLRTSAFLLNTTSSTSGKYNLKGNNLSLISQETDYKGNKKLRKDTFQNVNFIDKNSMVLNADSRKCFATRSSKV